MQRSPWQQELEVIDNLMRTISSITDPEEMVSTYWQGIPDIIEAEAFLAISRRGVEPPAYLITRSSRFTEHFNPWTQRDRLPRLTGGLLGEVAYAEKPVVIDDLPSRLKPDDPARFYLEGFQSLVALPQYDNGVALNVSMSLYESGEVLDHSVLPMIHWQASLFGRGTQNLVLRNQLQSALNALDRELQVVGEIQRSLLPRELPSIPRFSAFAHYHTSARAGGDYYDFFPLKGDAVGIFIADVSGHGTPAAVLMAITHAIAHSRPGEPQPPRDMLAHLNTHLTRSYTAAGTFVTALYATLDPATRRLTYATAGHNPPRLRRGGRIISIDEPRGLPLGIAPDETYTEATITLEPGDLLLLYTDGITEAMAPPAPGGRWRELFGVERLDRLLIEHPSAGPEEIVNLIREAVGRFACGLPATDDQTLLAVLCTG
jgi:phosphoserine phosphatase RsbU/P